MKACAMCGKEFDLSVYDSKRYVYKRGRQYFCGWECLRKYDKSEIEKNEMHFVAVNLTEWTAKGRFGKFTIKCFKRRGFWASYDGFPYKRKKLGWKKSLDEAIDACMDDENWEWTK